MGQVSALGDPGLDSELEKTPLVKISVNLWTKQSYYINLNFLVQLGNCAVVTQDVSTEKLQDYGNSLNL